MAQGFPPTELGPSLFIGGVGRSWSGRKTESSFSLRNDLGWCLIPCLQSVRERSTWLVKAGTRERHLVNSKSLVIRIVFAVAEKPTGVSRGVNYGANLAVKARVSAVAAPRLVLALSSCLLWYSVPPRRSSSSTQTLDADNVLGHVPPCRAVHQPAAQQLSSLQSAERRIALRDLRASRWTCRPCRRRR